ncbi:hypothetical protein CONCODRAFT_19298 [Conidiobolus coronatus NRRL 28638]|uniref:Zn(2)-C6 fungal-type domain-containing protein n=1 Tax=Conidiobolus coronatus (strain ATCC 28846 / CBS 209.66 / NRRL 28638) TaxID=796925 RepID=A0A137NZB2_CONC2|nr:hypothetical protein CONCODRAFT_19298 [Conidiobolus coronatus NRRL 28638]|eukprot:KXN67919.1 hypothetical protein CONCODRAFT_19298 [Conidiobolus coronatus NRRL 28638]
MMATNHRYNSSPYHTSSPEPCLSSDGHESNTRSCDCCRQKKIKCDRKPGKCTQCYKYDLECTYVDPVRKRGRPPNKSRSAHVPVRKIAPASSDSIPPVASIAKLELPLPPLVNHIENLISKKPEIKHALDLPEIDLREFSLRAVSPDNQYINQAPRVI